MRQTLSLGDIDDHKDDEDDEKVAGIPHMSNTSQSAPMPTSPSKADADANGDTEKTSSDIKVVVNGQDPPQAGTESTDSKPSMKPIESVQSQSPSSDSRILNDTD